MYKVLALNNKGQLTWCTCHPEFRGRKGRCNHVTHQNDGETAAEFCKRVSRGTDNPSFTDFKEKYSGYSGSGIRVVNPYTDKDYAMNVEIIGLEDGGGIQNCHIENAENICFPTLLPQVWLPKIDPENYRLNNEDIELLNYLGIKIGISKESLKGYSEGRHKYIKLYPSIEFFGKVKVVEPEELNAILEELHKNGPKEFMEEKEDFISKYINTDVNIKEFIKEKEEK